MSEHHQFLFPRDLHLPPPDCDCWKAAAVLEPRGQSIPQRALINLSFGLASLHEGSYQYDEHMRTPGDVIAPCARRLSASGHSHSPQRHHGRNRGAAGHGVTLGDLYADDGAAIGIARNTAWDRRPGNI